MTFDNKSNPPAWLASWHPDDAEWVKARKGEWKKVRSSPYLTKLMIPNKIAKSKIENFFLSGSAFVPQLPETEWQRQHFHPDTRPVPVGDGILVELWLTADDSEENWRNIYDKYSDKDKLNGRREFRRAIKALYPDYGNIFSGRDARIYRLLGPVRCRRDDYPEQDDEQYLNTCNLVNEGLGLAIAAHLNAEQPDADGVALAMAQEWCDSVPGWYEFKVEQAVQSGELFLTNAIKWLEELLQRCRDILASPDEYDPGQVRLSEDIIKCLEKSSLPDMLEKMLAQYLA